MKVATALHLEASVHLDSPISDNVFKSRQTFPVESHPSKSSTLLQQTCSLDPLFDLTHQSSLLDKPIVRQLQFLIRIRQLEVEPPQQLRHQFRHFQHGDVLAQARPTAGAELFTHRPVSKYTLPKSPLPIGLN